MIRYSDAITVTLDGVPLKVKPGTVRIEMAPSREHSGEWCARLEKDLGRAILGPMEDKMLDLTNTPAPLPGTAAHLGKRIREQVLAQFENAPLSLLTLMRIKQAVQNVLDDQVRQFGQPFIDSPRIRAYPDMRCLDVRHEGAGHVYVQLTPSLHAYLGWDPPAHAPTDAERIDQLKTENQRLENLAAGRLSLYTQAVAERDEARASAAHHHRQACDLVDERDKARQALADVAKDGERGWNRVRYLEGCLRKVTEAAAGR